MLIALFSMISLHMVPSRFITTAEFKWKLVRMIAIDEQATGLHSLHSCFGKQSHVHDFEVVALRVENEGSIVSWGVGPQPGRSVVCSPSLPKSIHITSATRQTPKLVLCSTYNAAA